MFPKVLADDFEAEELCNPPQAGSYLFVLKRGNSRTVSLSQYHRASTLTHKPLLHLKEKTLREQKQTGRENRGGGGGGWQSADEEQWRGTVYRSSFESANHSEGEHQLVRFVPTRGRKNERRGG